jgi:hypothetical protein
MRWLAEARRMVLYGMFVPCAASVPPVIMAANSKSLMVIVPAGLEAVINFVLIPLGKGERHNTLLKWLRQNPPIP